MSWSVRHDLNVCVKVPQIDRPSSGVQDLIRTSTGKDYGYSLAIDREKMIYLRTCMACMIDPREGDVYPSSTNLCFFLAFCFCIPFSFDAGRCSCAPLFGPADWLHMLACSLVSFHGVAYLAAAAILDGYGTGRFIFCRICFYIVSIGYLRHKARHC